MPKIKRILLWISTAEEDDAQRRKKIAVGVMERLVSSYESLIEALGPGLSREKLEVVRAKI